MFQRSRTHIGAAVLALAVAGAAAQVGERAAFVANNGNLEGSVTSFLFEETGEPIFVAKHVIETRQPGSPFVPGTNAYAIDITPNGRYVINSHTTGLDVTEQLTLWRVNRDATLTLEATFDTPDSPLDLGWINNELLAVTKTSFGGQNEVILYRFDADQLTLTELDRVDTGTFTSYLDIHPITRWVYAGDSNSSAIYVIEPAMSGELRLAQQAFTGAYPLSPTISHGGGLLYAAGGISGDGHTVTGMTVETGGTLTFLDTFTSPGDSPKGMAFSPDDSILYVDHGSDATVHSFFVEPDGSLTPTGHMFDVGLQGSHGMTITLDDLVLFTDDTSAIDGVVGLYSFDITPSGDFGSQNGPAVDTRGVSPEHLVGWLPPCPADMTATADDSQLAFGVPDGEVNVADFFYFLDRFATGDDEADLTGSTDPDDPAYGVPDGLVDVRDFFYFLDQFVQCQ